MARGWKGNSEAHRRAGRIGGMKTAQKYGREFFMEIGRKGGGASTGKFVKGSERATNSGKKGGRARATALRLPVKSLGGTDGS